MFERPGDLAVSADVGEDEIVNLNAIVGFVAIDADNVPTLGSERGNHGAAKTAAGSGDDHSASHGSSISTPSSRARFAIERLCTRADASSVLDAL